MVVNGLVQALPGACNQTIEHHPTSMKPDEMENQTGWLTAHGLELANVSHFRLEDIRDRQ